ncbi:MAG: hypothetical protein U2P59_01520 [Synergistota bacterium]|nr:hypothetical protein [Synergistota bacterium]
MSEIVSMSSNFTGPIGALVMSLIAMSIVFLVIVGLMLVMVVTHKLVNASMSAKSSKNSVKESN